MSVPFSDRQIVWRMVDDDDFWTAEVDGQMLIIEINDFPSRNLYTLIGGDDNKPITALADFDDWPVSWIREQK